MPNWCFNHAIFEHDDPAMIRKLIDGANTDKMFDTFVSMPKELRETSSPSEPNSALIEKHGYSDWYTWALSNWGTKWDAGTEDLHEENENEVTIHFQTAWSPPIAFYHAMTDLGFNISASFTEEAMQYAGVFENGEEESIDLDFDNDSQSWIDKIENEDLREIVQEEYDNWKEWNNEEEEDK